MHLRTPWFALLLGGCFAQGLAPGEYDEGAGPTFDPNADATACSVQTQVFGPSCTGCHRPGGQVPDLTFDALEALLDGRYVVPADPAGSLVLQKMSGTAGGVMPPSGMLDADRLALVERWINEGASFDCEPGEVVEPERYHPDDFALPEVHGPDLKQGEQDCRDCHGVDLTGGVGPSCDDCHTQGWRTTCTFCHGGTADDTGAPPRDLNGVTDYIALSFAPHTEHVVGARHPAYDCTTCHTKPEDVLSTNHIFGDPVRGVAEVRFEQGLSPEGTYADGTCDNLYCHGNGRATGSAARNDGARLCDSCHPSRISGRDAWATMSGEHEDHLREGVDCSECHAATVDDASAIVGPMLHVNGTPDLAFPPGTITRNVTCSGTCHGEDHDAEDW
ncbi:MAG: c-type cytochrome domain-containing protein [Deltaproteobacteria bacterium]